MPFERVDIPNLKGLPATLEKLELKDGDVLVLRTDSALDSQEGFDDLIRLFTERAESFPDLPKVLMVVLPPTDEITVLHDVVVTALVRENAALRQRVNELE